jgi:uncharacterized protein
MPHDPSSVAQTNSKRLLGYDLARFIAIYGVVVINMVIHVAQDFRGVGMIADGPAPLMWLYQMWWGRASAMLAVVAGAGLALMFKPTDGPEDYLRKRRILLRRALFLLVVGHLWNSSTLWSFSILHCYAFFLFFGMLFVKASPRALVVSAFAVIAASIILQVVTSDPSQVADFEPPIAAEQGTPDGEGPAPDFEDGGFSFGTPKIQDARFWNPWNHVMDTFVDGMYPLFPWLAFVLAGIWLVRVGVDRLVVRRRLMLGAAVVLAASFGIWSVASSSDSETVRMLTNIARIPPGLLYVTSAAAQAMLLICLCVSIGSWPSTARWSGPLIATGQMTFTIYIVQILIGGGDRQGLFDIIGFPPGEGVTAGWIRVALFFAVTVAACHFWKKRFGRGPLETAMRWFSDR